MENEMQKENLFFWPLNFFPYQPGEGHPLNFPFAHYENGDIFLSWGELAVRAYAKSKPEIAVKYIKNVLAKYEADGLSFQRYERKSQRGTGDDILAGNCMTVVGLYRDIYGTQLRYKLRNQNYVIDLSTEGSVMTVDDFAVSATQPFGLSVLGDTAEFFPGSHSLPALSVTRPRGEGVKIGIEAWMTSPTRGREWVESCAGHGVVLRHVVSDLQPHATYDLHCDGRKAGSFKADGAGRIEFKRTLGYARAQRFELVIQ
jgi:hypothetical protein